MMGLKLEEVVGKKLTEEQFDEAAGKKDACYHKVKARYDVWPSAYASGALVKCRKVGAKNWGNKSKKENIEENKKLVGAAIGIAKKMGGDMTGAVKKIEKLSKGLSKVKSVRDALRKANESINEQQYFDPNGQLKKYMDKVLKQAGIRVIKYDPMKQSFYNGIWGGFYTVASSNKVDMPGQGKVKRSSAVLPVYIDKRNQIELGVSGDGFKLGKVGSSQVLKKLKDFNKSDLQEGLLKEGSIEQRELKLYIDNDGQLYNSRYMPIIKNLSKKMKKGKFDKRLAAKGFMYLVDDGVKKYIRDFGGSKGMFSKKDKIEVAKEFADEFEEIYKNKEYDFMEAYDIWAEDGSFGYTMTGIVEAEYGGRKVKLGKPMQGDVKKFKVYVKNPKGNVVKVNFGQGGKAKGGTMKIRKSNPKARASFRARHNCDNPGPRHKARYWSCRKW